MFIDQLREGCRSSVRSDTLLLLKELTNKTRSEAINISLPRSEINLLKCKKVNRLSGSHLCSFVLSALRLMSARMSQRACFVLRPSFDGLRADPITNSKRSQN